MKINDFTEVFSDTKLNFLKSVLDKKGKIGGIHVTQGEGDFSRSELDGWVPKTQALGAKGLLWIRLSKDGKFESPVSKFLPDDFEERIKRVCSTFKPGDTLFLLAGCYQETWSLLGRLRLLLGHNLKLVKSGYSFCWITDFPLFEYDLKSKNWHSVHHPFTSPQDGWENLEVDEIKARSYDIILNGTESLFPNRS